MLFAFRLVTILDVQHITLELMRKVSLEDESVLGLGDASPLPLYIVAFAKSYHAILGDFSGMSSVIPLPKSGVPLEVDGRSRLKDRNCILFQG